MRNGIVRDLERATIGVITALPKEGAAVEAVFGPVLPEAAGERRGGRTYSVARVRSVFGREHVVAIAVLPDQGGGCAAARATMLLEHCQHVRHLIMVGIAGAVPHPAKPEHHVRLGDIVVSDRNGVVQYRFVKMNSEAEELRSPPRPPGAVLTDAVRSLQKGEVLKQRPWEAYIRSAINTIGAAARRPPQTADQLHDWNEGWLLTPHPRDLLRRKRAPRVFLGPIASADVLLKDPRLRDKLRDQYGVKAVEMEGAGIADASWVDGADFLVIRGTCDYCNKDKGDAWQLYAAIVAAAYARSVIEHIPVEPGEPPLAPSSSATATSLLDDLLAGIPLEHRHLADHVKSDSWYDRNSAAKQLACLGVVSIPILSYMAVHDGDKDVRECAVKLLGETESHLANPALYEALRDVHPWVRRAAALAIGKTADATAVSHLLQAVQVESEPGPKVAMIKSLGKLGDEYVCRFLERFQNDSDHGSHSRDGTVGEAAKDAIRRLSATSMKGAFQEEGRKKAPRGMPDTPGSHARSLKPFSKDVVRQVARALMNENGSTTTLDVKRHLRRSGYFAEQRQVSDAMKDIAAALGWTSRVNRDHLVYSTPPEPDQGVDPR